MIIYIILYLFIDYDNFIIVLLRKYLTINNLIDINALGKTR